MLSKEIYPQNYFSQKQIITQSRKDAKKAIKDSFISSDFSFSESLCVFASLRELPFLPLHDPSLRPLRDILSCQTFHDLILRSLRGPSLRPLRETFNRIQNYV